MTRADIINEVEKVFNVRYGWSKSYDNSTMFTDYTLYYNKGARKPLAWLQIGFVCKTNEIITGCISYNRNGERICEEVNTIEDIAEILKKVAP